MSTGFALHRKRPRAKTTHVARFFLRAEDLSEPLHFAVNVELRSVVLGAQALKLRGAVLRFLFAPLGFFELAPLALLFEALLFFGFHARFLLLLQSAL